MAVVAAALFGYLIGSIPLANLVARRHGGVDLRDRGDRNPGFWNAKQLLGRRSAVPIFVGDVLKGAAAAGIGVALRAGWGAGESWWIGYVGGAAAMIGHAWPVFADFRGGRSILCFAGAMCVLSPVPAAVAIGGCVTVSLVTRNFALGARVAVFGFPLVQALFDPRAHVAATGGLMTIIGVRFALAALPARTGAG